MNGVIEFDLAAWVAIRALVAENRKIRERDPKTYQANLEWIFAILERFIEE